MPRYIIKHENKYFEWSSVSEGPTTRALELSSFKKYYELEYGGPAMPGLRDRLERVESHGTSCQLGIDFNELMEISILNGKYKSKIEIFRELGYPYQTVEEWLASDDKIDCRSGNYPPGYVGRYKSIKNSGKIIEICSLIIFLILMYYFIQWVA
jgi:hypothetical protein